MNFDAVEATVSTETMPFSLSNVWRNPVIQESPTHVSFDFIHSFSIRVGSSILNDSYSNALVF